MKTTTRKRLREEQKKAALAKGHTLVGRNDPCPCGSGKKAKRCCLPTINLLASLPPHIRQQMFTDRILRQGPWAPPTPVPAAVAEKFAEVSGVADEDTNDIAASDAAIAEGVAGSFDDLRQELLPNQEVAS